MTRRLLCAAVLAVAGFLPSLAGGSGTGAPWPEGAGGVLAVENAAGPWTARSEFGGAPTIERDSVTGDTVVLFHFVPGRLMFYRDYPRMAGNAAEIDAVAALVERYREAIEAGRAVLRVKGFCGSYGSRAANLRAAKDRSNQVKSWFITHHGMREEWYRTTNSAEAYRGKGDVVAVVGVEWLPGFGPERDTVAVVPPLDTVAADTLPAEPERPAVVETPADTVVEEEAVPEPEPVAERVRIPLAVKTNLLYDALLLPTVEAEYLFNEKWSLNVEGSVAWWRIDGGVDKYYDLWIVSPEVRYWFKTRERWHGHHAGYFLGAGAYDLENGKQGYKGEYFMTGLAYGFMFPVRGCRSLHLEANVGVGYMYTEYEEYLPIDGHYVYQETGRTNYFGPLKAKFSLVWVLDLWKKKGGKR